MSGGIQSTTASTASSPNPGLLAQEQVVRRRTQEGTGGASSSSSSSSSSNINLPRCQPLELIVPPEVPPEVHSSPQIVIAHRGASSHLPEHSLEGYRLALELGADYIEPDLVATKDHHLVAMHSLDLTVTTNVEKVFGASKNKTRSTYKHDKLGVSGAEATGYWVYDFTLEELKQLRLKQRLGGFENNGRSKAFDGIFQIPTLTEILELLNDWNESIQPLWYHDSNNDYDKTKHSHSYPPPPRGLYAELKDFPWLLKDANINLIDLFFDHIAAEESVWKKTLLRHMCNTKRLREHEYKLAPLVMQSFEAEVLKNFTNRWEELANNKIQHEGISYDNEGQSNSTKSTLDLTFEVPLDSGNGDETARIPLPTPPTILLVGKDVCQEENFWYEMEDSYRNVITGVGPDKMCFFGIEPEQSQSVYLYQPTFMEKAREAGWKVHPWTERPEEAFFATTMENDEGSRRRRRNEDSLVPFGNVFEELLFLKCTVGVDGVFSESVDIAVRAMGMPCPSKHSHRTSSSSSNNTFDMNEIPLGPVIGFSFVSGILVGLMVWKYCGGGGRGNARANNNRQQQRRAPRILGRRQSNLPPHFAVPTEAADDGEYSDDDPPVVLDDTDREIL
jgi:glycerophosphoryl diester phosphodiesterase